MGLHQQKKPMSGSTLVSQEQESDPTVETGSLKLVEEAVED